ncbi:MAG: PGF-pre-PGF domain-containing protein, partial [Halobacteria archaeon]
PPPAPVTEAARVELPPVTAGQVASIPVASTPIQEIAVEAARNIREAVRIETQRFSARPSTASSSPSGRAYAYLAIEAPALDPGDVARVTLKAKVEKVWAATHKIAPESLKVERYTVTWVPLPTRVESQDARFIHLKAESPGLSFFAITGEEGSAVRPGLAPAAPSATPPPTPAPSAVYLPPVGGPGAGPARSPGFEAALAGISLAAALFACRNPRR